MASIPVRDSASWPLSRLSFDWRQGIAFALLILLWPFFVRPQPLFLVVTVVLVCVPLFVGRTAAQLIMVLFAYYAVDGYLRLLFEYSWVIYQLPLLAAAIVYLRWFLGPQWRRSGGTFRDNPVALPLIGLVGVYGLAMFNGVPWNPVISLGGFMYHLGTVPLFFIAASGFRDVADVRRILWFIVGLAVFQCGYAVLQYHVGPPEPVMLSGYFQARMAAEAWWAPGSTELVYRPTGLTLGGGGPGMYGFVGLVLITGLVETWRGLSWRKLVTLAGAFVMLLAVFLSAVRSFWLALGVSLLFFGLVQGIRYLPLVVATGWAAAAVAIQWTHGFLHARLSTIATPWATFSSERAGDVLALPDIVAHYPMGIGLGRAAGSAASRARELFPGELYGGAHNYWVSITWEASAFAALLLAWLLWRLFNYGFMRLGTAPDRGTRGIIAAILALDAGIVAMTFAGPSLAGVASSFAQFFWFLSGILLALPRRPTSEST